MPVASQNAIPNAAPVQWESHVRTAVIDSVHLSIMIEYGDGMPSPGHNGASSRSHLVQGSNPDVPFEHHRHSVLLLPRLQIQDDQFRVKTHPRYPLIIPIGSKPDGKIGVP